MELNAAMARLWQELPAIKSFASICHMRGFTGSIDFDAILSISNVWRLFGNSQDQGRRTAILALDRFAPLYVRAIALCFPGRELAVFRSLTEVCHWLDPEA